MEQTLKWTRRVASSYKLHNLLSGLAQKSTVNQHTQWLEAFFTPTAEGTSALCAAGFKLFLVFWSGLLLKMQFILCNTNCTPAVIKKTLSKDKQGGGNEMIVFLFKTHYKQPPEVLLSLEERSLDTKLLFSQYIRTSGIYTGNSSPTKSFYIITLIMPVILTPLVAALWV